VAAGLGELGWSGTVLTPEFGPRQRFTVIITEAPLEESRLYEGAALCSRCMNCVAKCPVGAIDGNKKHTIEIDGKTFEYGVHNRLRCDWSKRYALVAEEGPGCIGSVTNIMPPEKITPDTLAEALKQMDPLQKACMVIVENCIKECKAILRKN
jgi:ferredoxin